MCIYMYTEVNTIWLPQHIMCGHQPPQTHNHPNIDFPQNSLHVSAHCFVNAKHNECVRIMCFCWLSIQNMMDQNKTKALQPKCS